MVPNMAPSPLLVVRIVKSRVASHVCQSLLRLSAVPGMAEVESSGYGPATGHLLSPNPTPGHQCATRRATGFRMAKVGGAVARESSQLPNRLTTAPWHSLTGRLGQCHPRR